MLVSAQAFYDGTITTGTNDSAVEIAGLKTTRDIIIINNSGGDLEFKINSTSYTAIKLGAGNITLENVAVGVVYLTNNSGASIDYQIICLGT